MSNVGRASLLQTVAWENKAIHLVEVVRVMIMFVVFEGNCSFSNNVHYWSCPTLSGSLTFDMEYSRWLYEHQRQIGDLRVAVNSHVSDNELSLLVDAVMAHYDEVFKLKSIGAKSNIFHMLSGMWTTPAERCFMWLGGFRSSELLKVRPDSLYPRHSSHFLGFIWRTMVVPDTGEPGGALDGSPADGAVQSPAVLPAGGGRSVAGNGGSSAVSRGDACFRIALPGSRF